jgi:hypothetical protein
MGGGIRGWRVTAVLLGPGPNARTTSVLPVWLTHVHRPPSNVISADIAGIAYALRRVMEGELAKSAKGLG